MTAKAYVVGQLVRNQSTKLLELREIEVTSYPAQGLTCMDGIYWCDFGQPCEGNFHQASELAAEQAEYWRQWLRVSP